MGAALISRRSSSLPQVLFSCTKFTLVWPGNLDELFILIYSAPKRNRTTAVWTAAERAIDLELVPINILSLVLIPFDFHIFLVANGISNCNCFSSTFNYHYLSRPFKDEHKSLIETLELTYAFNIQLTLA